jgi:long-subunit acyl-CoA synthetase (AMP-forming)
MSGAALFEALARRPADTSVLGGGETPWSAGAVLTEAEALAGHLRGRQCLAVLADNSPTWAIADLGALRAGIPLLPLPTFFTPGQLRHALEQSGTDTLLTDDPGRIAALACGFIHEGNWQGLAWMARRTAKVGLPSGTAKISFTSGSTGTPKGVCLSATGLLDTAAAIAARLADLPIACHLAVLPLSLLLENSAGLYAPLLRGAEVCLPPLAALGWRGMSGFEPSLLQQAVTAFRPDSLILVPELLKAWSLYLAATQRAAPAGLTYVAVGGARVDAAVLATARHCGIPAHQGYGLTECGSVVSLNRPGDDGDDVGQPLDHAAVQVAGDEIIVTTRAFLGYLGDPPRAFADRGEFLTGDLGWISADGHLHLSGRRKNLLITSFGRNVAPEWVESALLAQPAILQAVVAGEGRPWLAAVIVAAPGCDEAEVAAAVAAANAGLPDYARIGGWIPAAPFTLANQQATGNGRPLRDAILTSHAAALAELYACKELTDVVL